MSFINIEILNPEEKDITEVEDGAFAIRIPLSTKNAPAHWMQIFNNEWKANIDTSYVRAYASRSEIVIGKGYLSYLKTYINKAKRIANVANVKHLELLEENKRKEALEKKSEDKKKEEVREALKKLEE